VNDAARSFNNGTLQDLGIAQASEDEDCGLTRELRYEIKTALTAKVQVE
jgi:hypothetical protein